jgi:AraC-like DNA-binding protein
MPGDGRSLAGVGTPCDSLERLPTSYREALTVLNNAVFSQAPAADGPLYFEDLGRGGPSSLTVPAEREGELLTRTRMGDFAAVSALLDEILAGAAGRGAGSFIAMQSFFYSLLSTALKAAEGTGLPLTALVDERRIMELGSAREMREYLLPLYRAICDSQAWQRAGHALRARTEILQHIDENCLDNGISLRTIASRFGVSVPYLSRFIKDQTGENFVEYVARRRIARAKEMLAAGDVTIEQVSQSVGYVNLLTFRRAFKRYEGVNPGDYRGSVARGRPAPERAAQPTYRI